MAEYGNIESSQTGVSYQLEGQKNVITRRAAETIAFGIPVFGYAGDDVNVYAIKQDTAQIVWDGDFVTSNVITITVAVDGDTPVEVEETFDTDHDTTMDNIVAAIEAAVGLEGIDASLPDEEGNNRTLKLFHKGYNIEVTEEVTLGAGQANGVITYTNSQIFLGVSEYNQNVDTEYAEDAPVNVLNHGSIVVETQDAVNSNTKAYVIWSYDTPADQGLYTDESTDNYDTGCYFAKSTVATGLTIVDVRGTNVDTTP